MLVFECGDQDDFESEKFSAFVPMRMFYQAQVARFISIRAFVCLCLCLCCKIQRKLSRYFWLCFAFVYFCICTFVYMCIHLRVCPGVCYNRHVARSLVGPELVFL